MEKLFKILSKKPKLYEQTNMNMWEDDHVSKGMLNAHLDTTSDLATRNQRFVEESVNWITSLVPPENYPRLLDLGCGPGVYTELFCEKGYHVTGIDLSKRSIDYAVNSARKKQLRIDYISADYTKLHIEYKYHLVTLIYCDFGVLSTKTRQELLSKIYEALLPNGILIFDVFTPQKYVGIQESKGWELSENGFWHEKLCFTLNSFFRYEEDNTFLNRYTLITVDNEILTFNVWEHTFMFEELKHDLEQAGFRNINFFADVTGKKCSKKDHTICVMAEK